MATDDESTRDTSSPDSGEPDSSGPEPSSPDPSSPEGEAATPAKGQAASKPEISYPAEWGYRIVCTSAEEVRVHLREVLDEVEHELVEGNESASGKYVTLQLSLVVNDEEHRLRIYEHLGGHEAVRFVL